MSLCRTDSTEAPLPRVSPRCRPADHLTTGALSARPAFICMAGERRAPACNGFGWTPDDVWSEPPTYDNGDAGTSHV